MNQTLSKIPTSPPNCPVCQSETQLEWTKVGIPLFSCTDCDHLFCQVGDSDDFVENVFDDDYFQSGNDGYQDYLAGNKPLIARGKKYAKLLSKHGNINSVLDVGCAAGFLLKGMAEFGWSGLGIEPNPTMAKLARKLLADTDIQIKTSTIEAEAPEEKFDAATIIQVISHLRDPVQCLQKINQHLNDDGLLLIETWNRKSWTARAFGSSWHQYNPPSVLHWYTKKHLSKILAQTGFEVVEQGRPTKWISLGNGFALIQHSLRDSQVGSILASPLGLCPKSLCVPYFLDDVFWVVARKVSSAAPIRKPR